MSKRSATLADQLEKAVEEFAATIERCSDQQWRAICGDEKWTVAATAQHVAGQFPLEREYISAAAEGHPMPSYTWDDINGKNDKRASENTNCGKAGVLALLRKDAPSMAAYIRGLSDEQLDRTATLALADGASVTTEQLIAGGVLTEHVTGHMKSILAAG